MVKEYFKEIQGLSFYETEYGFVAYKIEDDNLHIRHIYVKPEARAMKVATMMADQLVAAAKEEGCTTMTADVEPSNSNVTDSTKFILAYGLRIIEASEDEIFFMKEI
jgi:ribosomal protein S18 acetylase RimI-like enzyme